MKHAATQALYSYWDELRGGRAAPERSDVDPAAIRSLLADTFLLEIDGPSGSRERHLTVRLSGTRLNALFAEEIKGREFLTLWSHGDRSSVAALITAVLDDASPAVAGLVAGPAGSQPLGLELLLLPLRHQGKTHARLIGSIVPAEVPQWLGLVATEPLHLISERILGNADAHGGGRKARFQGFRNAPIARHSPTRREHLLVYEGGQQSRRKDFDGVIRS